MLLSYNGDLRSLLVWLEVHALSAFLGVDRNGLMLFLPIIIAVHSLLT